MALLIAAIWIVERAETPRDVPVRPQSPAERPVVAVPPPPLNRAGLIDAAARAADAHARGVPSPPDIGGLVGRRFTLKLPFGCSGPASEDQEMPFRWRYDVEQETLRASVTPEVWTKATFLKSIVAAKPFEAAEGFWIARPWIRIGDCPAQPQVPPEQPPTEAPETAAPPRESGGEREMPAETLAPVRRETLGIVELFEPGSRRAARRNGSPYELVTKIAPNQIDLSRGLRLVIEGRLAPLAGPQPIACQAREGEDRPPLCLIGVNVDRVAITGASGQRVLAEWAD
ncbi:hypothetical protein [Sphingosinicella rhizophila]|uniref:Uncharacterized protein n=1 Tax=Sphingosinicella rhizophila TaxID=3050082 RepID=A0ABU3Q709_9SPHN|nr:hypothetical protein [Sphingosinicella sp. GR2756]MDT9599102.1 hypothetical protein [Sphingosinicella sp. GR2756]